MMKELFLTEEEKGVSREQLESMLDELLAQYSGLKKVLIIPPDYTRCYSYAGIITQILYTKLAGVHVDVMSALGTHMPMSEDELNLFFGNVVPRERIIVHHWQTDTVRLGFVPAEFCAEISGGREMINKSHMLSAICGLEKARRENPTRLRSDCNDGRR